MKKLLLAVLTGVLVEMTAIATELPSLPIGSTNALVEYSVAHVNAVVVDLKKVVNNTWTWLYLGPGFPYRREDGPLDEFISARLKEALEQTIDLKDHSLRGVTLHAGYGGVFLDAGKITPLLGTGNFFTLKENGGEWSIPEEAYRVDLVEAETESIHKAFLVPGIERATLVARDGNGKVIKEFDSQKPPPSLYTPQVAVREGVLWLPRDYIVNATPGEVTIWYKDGTSQIFDLATGKLLSPVTTRLTIERLGSALKLTVIASAGTAFVLEYSSEVGFAKTEAAELASEQMGASGAREYLITPTGEMKFFRARLVQPK